MREVLDSQAVRIGFLTQLLWPRYGPFWRALVEAAGAEACFPSPAQVRARWDTPAVSAVPALAFRLAAAQASALGDCDAIVLPELVRDDAVQRGGAQDPWIADLRGALADAVPNLPELIAVPARLDVPVEGRAVALLQFLLHDAAQVGPVWSRVRARAKPPRLPSVSFTRRPDQTRTVGLVGQPWLLNDALAARVSGEDELLVSQHRLEPRPLEEEGRRAEERLVDSDAEVLGAARMFGRRGGVTQVRLLIDAGSGADAWLAARVRRLSHRPVDVVAVQDVVNEEDLVDTLSNGPVD